MKSRPYSLTVIVLVAISLAGCVTIYKDPKDMLKAAGFRLFVAGSPSEVAMLKSLPSNHLSPVINHGRVYYIYPDTENGRAYAGTNNEYHRYEKLQSRQKIAVDQIDDASVAKAPDWTGWRGLSDGWYTF